MNISITPIHTKKIITLKRILTNLTVTVFCLSLFSNIKKAYLQISKYLTQSLAYPLFQILKKHTYESQNTLFILKIILKETIYKKTIIQTIPIKTIIQTDKHQVKFICIACIPIIIIKFFLLFSLLYIRMNGKNINLTARI